MHTSLREPARRFALSRREVLGSLSALTVGAALVSGTRLAGAAQQTAAPETPTASLSELNATRADRSPVVDSGLVWRGFVAHEAHLRAEPNTYSEIVRDLTIGDEVTVPHWVAGEEVETQNPVWAETDEGHYVFSTLLNSLPVQDPPPITDMAPRRGRWIDVNLTLEIVTTYDGRTPLTTFLGSTGRPGWDTPIGTYSILRRVPREEMRGPDYDVPNVLWTQYFTDEGHALHGNYWRAPDTFGMPGSHGCVSMPDARAEELWNFASVGTLVLIHR